MKCGARAAGSTQGPSNPQSKIIFGRFRQLLAINASKMAPRPPPGLQDRSWDAPTKCLLWVVLGFELCLNLCPGSAREASYRCSISPSLSLSRSLSLSLSRSFALALALSPAPSFPPSLPLALSRSLSLPPSLHLSRSLCLFPYPSALPPPHRLRERGRATVECVCNGRMFAWGGRAGRRVCGRARGNCGRPCRSVFLSVVVLSLTLSISRSLALSLAHTHTHTHTHTHCGCPCRSRPTHNLMNAEPDECFRSPRAPPASSIRIHAPLSRQAPCQHAICIRGHGRGQSDSEPRGNSIIEIKDFSINP